jgi:hypothetical protein
LVGAALFSPESLLRRYPRSPSGNSLTSRSPIRDAFVAAISAAANWLPKLKA